MAKQRGPVLRVLFTTLVVLWSINLVASIFVDGRVLQKRWFPKVSSKAKRPSLTDAERAQTIFREDGQVRTRYEPYVAWTRKPFAGEAITIDDAGNRVTPVPAGRGDSVAGHVRFFGGSTMWGTGVDDQNTIPAHFNTLHPGYAVENHGEAGYISRQGLARVIDLFERGEPMDLVIFYDGCNDLYTLCREDVTLTGHREQAKMARRLKKSSAVADGLFGSTLEVARAIGQELGIGVHEPEVLCPDDPEFAQRVAETMVNNWRIARHVTQLAGGEFHAFLQPVATLGNPTAEYLGDPKRGRRAACYLTVYPLVQKIIREAGEDWMHDMTDIFDIEDYVYIDSCHVNGLGNEIAAKRMDELVGHVLASKDD